eukprot:EG_transcript_3509
MARLCHLRGELAEGFQDLTAQSSKSPTKLQPPDKTLAEGAQELTSPWAAPASRRSGPRLVAGVSVPALNLEGILREQLAVPQHRQAYSAPPTPLPISVQDQGPGRAAKAQPAAPAVPATAVGSAAQAVWLPHCVAPELAPPPGPTAGWAEPPVKPLRPLPQALRYMVKTRRQTTKEPEIFSNARL